MSPNKLPRYVQTVLWGIKKGISPCRIHKTWRQDCVAALVSEGYSIVEIARLFCRCQRTIKKDLKNVSKVNSARFASEFANVADLENKITKRRLFID